MFDILKQALGSVLSFLFETLTAGLVGPGWGYGLAIIGLTIVINVVVFPLTLKQTRATRAFTAIQPEIKRIQKEYKDEPQEMQKRLMETQKSAGATPGGCLLPLLVQMPIWFALFRLLQTPIVLDPDTGAIVQGAAHSIDPSSALGQTILSDTPPTFLQMMLGTSPSQAMAVGLGVALPYLIMMAVMVATQYVQQWHSTYGQDRPDQKGAGAQQAITKVMPLFIGFISYNFPAGLVLYWTTSNLFRLGQQFLIFKIDGRPTMASDNEEEGESSQEEDSSDDQSRKPQPGASKKRRRRRRR